MKKIRVSLRSYSKRFLSVKLRILPTAPGGNKKETIRKKFLQETTVTTGGIPG